MEHALLGTQKDTVAFQSIAYQAMAQLWKPLDTLLGGTRAMRDAGETYLPRGVHEKPAAYERRKKRSFLFGAYRSALRRIVSKPFSKPIALSNIEKLSDELQGISKVADPQGRSLDSLCRDVFWEGWHRGLSHIFIDYPKTDRNLTLGQQRDMDIRPYWVRISPKDLIRWDSDRGPDGKERLTMIAVREQRVQKVGDYSEKEVEYIRIFRADGTWELHEKVRDKGWVRVEEGTHDYPGIPLVTFYTNQTGFMQAEPPLEDLGWLNIEHWQSSSDQNTILNVTRVPILFRKGSDVYPQDDGKEAKEIVIGPHNFEASNDSAADMKYVEHSGAAIGAGQESIERIERRMEVLSMRPFIERSGNQTATGKALDTAETDTDVKASAREMGSVIRAAWDVSGKWVGEELPEDFSASLNTDFGLNLRSDQTMKTLLEARIAGQLSPEAYVHEMKRRWMGNHYDIDAEIIYIQDSASLKPMSDDDDSEDDADEDDAAA